MLSKVRTLLRLSTAWIIHPLAFLIPRDKTLWVFVGWHRSGSREFFADNSKYFYLYASRQAATNGTTPVWLSPDPALVHVLRTHGYRAQETSSLRGIYYALRAGYTFIDANMTLGTWGYAGGSKVIQLWHGVPIKKIGYQTDTPRSKLLFPNLHVQPYLNVSTSAWYTSVSAEAFNYDPQTFCIVGLPRNDALLEDVPDAAIGQHELSTPGSPHGGPSFLYAPTFRRQESSNPLDHIDLSALLHFLEQEDAIFYIALHPKFSTQTARWEERFNARIIFIGGGHDLYPQLSQFDVCISDYSSISIDFLLLDRPIVHYQYDLDEYSTNPGFQDRAEELMPGYRARSFNELLAALKNVCDGNDPFAAARAHARSLAFDHQDGRSSERLFNVITKDSR